MNLPQSTLIQSWPRWVAVGVWICILSLHALMFLLGALLAPELFHESLYEGSTCQQARNGPPTWYSNETSDGNCIPLAKDERAPLGSVITSFRFPRSEDEVPTYSIWNWKLTASLMMDVTFYTKQNIPELIIGDEVENATGGAASPRPPGFTIVQREILTEMRANLDSAPMGDFKEFSGAKMGWFREAQIHVERKLQCTVSTSYNNSQVEDLEMTSQYICSLNPFMNLHLPRNRSYIITLEFLHAPEANTSSETRTDSKFFATPADINPYLTVVTEDAAYHWCVFYLKCTFTPAILTALLWFCMRMYLNDLFISIPDRLLIVSAMCLFVQNIPSEVIAAQWPVPYIKLVDELSLLGLTCSLLLFWIVYVKDKLAKNEPWERNTRYYWRQFFLTVFTILVAALFVLYNRGPSYQSPFKNHWQTGPTVIVSLTCIFGLAVAAMIYQTYLSILVFKVLCDVSIQYPCLERVLRIKVVLLYCFSMSVMTVGGFVLQLAIQLGLNWNPQFYIDPIPFYLSYSSPLLIGLQGSWNIHVVSLLILLSRRSRSIPDYIRPVKYTRQGSISVEANVNHCSSEDDYPKHEVDDEVDEGTEFGAQTYVDEPMSAEEAIYLWEIESPETHAYIWKAHPDVDHGQNGYRLALSASSPLPEEEVE
eukprot:maker-scaffold769_size100554-snap-gene-0.17 protein:Tk04819 transcript:maker-scaffold769_size100554-snap-gene-0.17-mRNA-1 annotation:"protein wntless"